MRKDNKKIKFVRRNSLLKRLKNKWRKPKGLHNKLRLRKKGKGRKPSTGYGNKTKIQDQTLILNLSDLENCKKNIIISSTIGLKKKLEIIKKAKELKLKILNIKDVEKFIENINKKKEDKKKIKSEKQKKKVKIEEKKEKRKEEKKEETKDSQEDKQKKIKEEKKKVLEKGL